MRMFFFLLIVKCTFCQNYFYKIIICKTIKKFVLINKFITSIKIIFFLFIRDIFFNKILHLNMIYLENNVTFYFIFISFNTLH